MSTHEDGLPTMDDSNSKRRRGLGMVTANACTECRKKRAKCDGQTPCARCTSQKGVECIYEVPIRQSKEKMRAEMEILQQRLRKTDRVLAALATPDTSEQVLEQIRGGEPVESISDRLAKTGFMASSEGDGAGSSQYDAPEDAQHSGAMSSSSQPISPHGDQQSHDHTWTSWEGSNSSHNEDTMNWRPDPPKLPSMDDPTGEEWFSPAGAILNSNVVQRLARDATLGSNLALAQPGQRLLSWTRMTSDTTHIQQLMALYFCWEYPIFAPFSKEHFLAHYQRGSKKYCSSILVNAILALGCRFSAQEKARTDPNDSNTAGDHFYDEFSRLYHDETDHHKLTTIQALVLMSLREGSCGRTTQGLYYSGQAIRLAIEMGLVDESDEGQSETLEADEEHTVRSATYWGCFSLDQAWSMMVGKIPHLSQYPRRVLKPAILEEVEASSWFPYTDDASTPERSSVQKSNIRSIFKTFCELSETIHRSMYALYTPGSNINSRVLLDSYTDYLSWYDSIPEALRLGSNSTPSVLFAHMEYHSAILLLFRPFMKLNIRSSGFSPRDICTQAADAISALVYAYSQLYSLSRTPSFVPYFVLASSIIHLANLTTSDTNPNKFHQSIADLEEMAPSHGFASRALDILRSLAKQWAIDVEFDKSTPSFEERSKAWSESPNLFRPGKMGRGGRDGRDGGDDDDDDDDDDNDDDDDGDGDGDRGGDGLKAGKHPFVRDSSGNPLFWTFPLQGMPFCVAEPRVMLEAAGFRVLEERVGDEWGG